MPNLYLCNKVALYLWEILSPKSYFDTVGASEGLSLRQVVGELFVLERERERGQYVR